MTRFRIKMHLSLACYRGWELLYARGLANAPAAQRSLVLLVVLGEEVRVSAVAFLPGSAAPKGQNTPMPLPRWGFGKCA